MYQALYRKYRPLNFDEIVGQEHITTVLKNQIESGEISHAYLFSGTRGTGKTSAAKIFSRAINCLDEGPKPCNKCSACLENLNSSTIDIIEIDAASNNGVDNIRDLKDRAFYQPTSQKYKVYIIDEVHMLSKGAFNALLKILEEPPKHLIFILATTEPERIPLTILSRCQKYQFKRIESNKLLSALKKIADKENVSVDEKTFELIISSSDGSFRDALSILDQLLTSGKSEVDYDFAMGILGMVDSGMIFDLIDNLLLDKSDVAFEILDEIISSGKDIEQLCKDLLSHFRYLMIAKVAKNTLSRYIYSDNEEYIAQSEKIKLDDILKSMDVLIKQLNEMRYSQQQRALLEISAITISEILGKRTGVSAPHAEVKTETVKAKETKTEVKKAEPRGVLTQADSIESFPEADLIKPEEDGVKELDSSDINMEDIHSDWISILNEIKNSKKKSLHALIIESTVVSMEKGVLTLGYDEKYSFHKMQLSDPGNLEIVEKVISMFYNKPIKVNTIFINDKKDELIKKDIDILTELVGSENVEII